MHKVENPTAFVDSKTKANKSCGSKKPVAKMITHNVAPKETLYGIEKNTDVSDEALKKQIHFEKKDCKLGKHLLFRQIGQKTSNSVQNQVVS
jgi:LysM repeat protein